MYATALTQQGYKIWQAATSAEALQEIRRHSPDVVVTDVCLPVVGGLDLLRIIRNDQDTKDIPVIVLSGYAGSLGELSQAAELGANAVRVKPLAPESLGLEIADLVEKSRKLRVASAEMRMRAAEVRGRADGALFRSEAAKKRAKRAIERAARIRRRS